MSFSELLDLVLSGDKPEKVSSKGITYEWSEPDCNYVCVYGWTITDFAMNYANQNGISYLDVELEYEV